MPSWFTVNLIRRLPAFRRIEAELARLRSALAQQRSSLAALEAERDEMLEHARRLDRERAEGLARELQMTAELADAADHIARLYHQRDALLRERDELRDHVARIEREKEEREAHMVRAEARLAELNSWLYAPPGHFYSPIVDPADPRVASARIDDLNALDGRTDIEIDEPRMLSLLERIGEFYGELPWSAERRPGIRFCFDNPNFAYGDAITLYGLLRLYKPRRFLEVGCGYSSLVSMDVNDLFLGGTMDTLYVDPFPETLEKLLDDADPYLQHIRPLALQDVPLEWFSELEAGDLLFIDSSHVLKTGSDVCDALFRVLPALAPGVIVHFHDVVYPFEYPPEWIVRERRSWNEVYALRAFLQYNGAFRILFFNSLVYRKYPRETAIHAPLCERNAGGGLWLEKA